MEKVLLYLNGLDTICNLTFTIPGLQVLTGNTHLFFFFFFFVGLLNFGHKVDKWP